ncbi:DNA-binding protein [Klebsiella pneumoniae]|uniref:DNA-binding protein n=5 Tax=Gammaproteobacteria TaxID=1236 RepID=A0A377W2Y4_KLEPN|nr:DNA-binding protein [Klebsiella pneumoniae]
MAGRIDYDIEKYQFTEAGETPRLREQWREVYLECRQLRAGAEERLRIALLNVDYVTSFELPFRLLLVRAPQLIADVRETLQLSRKAAVFNGKRYGCVYSLKQDLQAVPEAFHYRLANRIRRVDATGLTAAPYQQIAREIKPARERLRQALNAGLPVTALDALFWFGQSASGGGHRAVAPVRYGDCHDGGGGQRQFVQYHPTSARLPPGQRVSRQPFAQPLPLQTVDHCPVEPDAQPSGDRPRGRFQPCAGDEHEEH